MKTLYLLRHAHTLSMAPMGDQKRILSPEGAKEAESVGDFMAEHNMYPNFVLSSSAARTIQTSQIIFTVLFRTIGTKIDSHFDGKLYQASAETLLDEIHAIEDRHESLLVVAHNPGIAKLAMILDGSNKIKNYQPATLSVFEAKCDAWKDISSKTAELKEVFVPDVR